MKKEAVKEEGAVPAYLKNAWMAMLTAAIIGGWTWVRAREVNDALTEARLKEVERQSQMHWERTGDRYTGDNADADRAAGVAARDKIWKALDEIQEYLSFEKGYKAGKKDSQ